MSATVDLTNPIFTDLEAARKHFESIRWPDGAYCPFCGQFDSVKVLGGESMCSIRECLIQFWCCVTRVQSKRSVISVSICLGR